MIHLLISLTRVLLNPLDSSWYTLFNLIDIPNSTKHHQIPNWPPSIIHLLISFEPPYLLTPFDLSPLDSSWHILTPLNSSELLLAPFDSPWFALIPLWPFPLNPLTSWLLLTWVLLNPLDSSWLLLTPLDSSWLLLTPLNSYWLPLIRLDSP